MPLPFLEDITIILVTLSICSLIPAQIFFAQRETLLMLNKKTFIEIAQLLGVVTILFLSINAYLIILG